MAMIETRANADGTTSYRVKVRMRGFPSQTATFARKTDAKEWAKQTEIAIKEGKYFKTAEAKKHTFKELVDRYLEYVKLRNPQRHKWVELYLGWWTEQLGDYSCHLGHVVDEERYQNSKMRTFFCGNTLNISVKSAEQ